MKRFPFLFPAFVLIITAFVAVVLFISSCHPEVETDYLHTISSTNSNPDGAAITAYYNNKTQRTTINNSEYDISFTTTNPEELIDSIIATANGYNKFKTTNIRVGTSAKTLNINLEKIPEEIKVFYLYSQSSTPAGAKVQAFDNGATLSTTTVQDDKTYQSNNMNLPLDNKLDSVVITAPYHDKQTIKNLTVQENANQLDVNLTEQQKSIVGKTIIIGKVADERNYNTNDQE